MAGGLPPLSARITPTAIDSVDFDSPGAVEVSEVMHDPELDEAVIAFANADFRLRTVAAAPDRAGGSRHQHAETWLVLFDLYRATGQQPSFESLALDYAQQFGWSAPQWYSLPKQVADAVAEEEAGAAARRQFGRGLDGAARTGPGRRGPAALADAADAAALGVRLERAAPHRHRSRHAAVDAVPPVGGPGAGNALAVGEQLFTVLAEAAPTGVKDADPAFWLTRLDALRLVNRADQFDEPPSTTASPTRCRRRRGSPRAATCASAARRCPRASRRHRS
jgi:hypothetical protein